WGCGRKPPRDARQKRRQSTRRLHSERERKQSGAWSEPPEAVKTKRFRQKAGGNHRTRNEAILAASGEFGQDGRKGRTEVAGNRMLYFSSIFSVRSADGGRYRQAFY